MVKVASGAEPNPSMVNLISAPEGALKRSAAHHARSWFQCSRSTNNSGCLLASETS